MQDLARLLAVMGVVLLVLSGLVFLLTRFGVQPGRLPGDIRFQAGGVTCFIPLVTSIVLSILLTIVLNIIIRLINR